MFIDHGPWLAIRISISNINLKQLQKLLKYMQKTSDAMHWFCMYISVVDGRQVWDPPLLHEISEYSTGNSTVNLQDKLHATRALKSVKGIERGWIAVEEKARQGLHWMFF